MVCNRTSRIELLAPAGTQDAFYAALHSGADAIYLGAGLFHARQFAGDIDEDQLLRLVQDAHIAGVRVYLTLNTLLTDSELTSAGIWAKKAWEFGVDAIIVQDIGLLHYLHNEMPDMVLHASTQMSIHNSDGVLAAETSGITRVVLARELSIDTIAEIKSLTTIALEVFTHGALCVCYSGQCLMSSLIGGRSGNRGKCAQPCRLNWQEVGYTDPSVEWMTRQKGDVRAYGHLLSMKDLKALSVLPELQRAGISSLKIEGRMKSAEYVSVVTGTYRKYLDRLEEKGSERFTIEAEDEKNLLQIFNRGGFTRRYLQEGSSNREPLVDVDHPKNLGVMVGTVVSWSIPYAQILLIEDVSIGDGLEIHGSSQGSKHVVSTILTAIMQKGHHEKKAFSGYTVFIGDIKEPVFSGDLVYRTSLKQQLQEARAAVSKWMVHRCPLHMTFTMVSNEKAVLEVEDDECRKVSVFSEMLVEVATQRPMDIDRIEDQLKKTGDAPWFLSTLKVNTDSIGTLPVKEINAMRRNALQMLTDLRVDAGLKHEFSINNEDEHRRKCDEKQEKQNKNRQSQWNSTIFHQPVPFPEMPISVAFAQIPTVEWIQSSKLSSFADKVRLILPLVSEKQLNSIKQVFTESIWIQTPSVIPEESIHIVINLLDKLGKGIDGVTVGNIGLLHRLRKEHFNLPILADSGMNIWNKHSLLQVKEWGADAAVLSPELAPNQINEWIDNSNSVKLALPVWNWVYGRVPVMTLDHCPGSLSGSCNDQCAVCLRNKGILIDRAGAEFPWIRHHITQKTIIYYHTPMIFKEYEKYHGSTSQLVFITDEKPDVFEKDIFLNKIGNKVNSTSTMILKGVNDE